MAQHLHITLGLPQSALAHPSSRNGRVQFALRPALAIVQAQQANDVMGRQRLYLIQASVQRPAHDEAVRFAGSSRRGKQPKITT